MKNNNNTLPSTSKAADLDFQDLLHIAQAKRTFQLCKIVTVGDLPYPVIASDSLMEIIAFDDNFVEAARKVKRNAFNPNGSEHGIVKKVCDMIINHPDFRHTISRYLIQGIYSPEMIAYNHGIKEKHMTLPRGFKYTINQIVQTMIMQIVELSWPCGCTMPYAWGEKHNPGVGKMLESIDHLRAKGFKYWISLKLKSFLERIPHDRLIQKIHIMFQDKRVANLVCTLLGLHVSASNESKRNEHVGISKDSPLAAMLGYELYLSELDQEINRLGLTHVRYDGEIIVFCDSPASAEQIKDGLSAFAKNTLLCPFDQRRTIIKDIAHLAFIGLELQGGRWRIQYKVKNTAASAYIVAIIVYTRLKDETQLWEAYRDLTRFINYYDGAYALENEVRRLKQWRDEHFINAIVIGEKVKLGLIKLPEQ